MTDFSRQYPMIQSAFKEGIELIFGTLFTDSIYLHQLDLEKTTPNVYDEAPTKVYLPPIKLVGGIRLNANIAPEGLPLVEKDLLVKIPTKQLILNNIPHTTETHLDSLRKAKFTYKTVDYFIDFIRPSTFVADMWHLYQFECSKAIGVR